MNPRSDRIGHNSPPMNTDSPSVHWRLPALPQAHAVRAEPVVDGAAEAPPRVARADGGDLPSGWYLLAVSQPDAPAPAVVLEPADGGTAAYPTPLAPGRAQGDFVGVLQAVGPLRGLRLLPAPDGGATGPAKLTLQRLGPFAAARHMWSALRERAPWAAVRLLPRLAWRAATAGRTAAGDLLVQQYVAALRDGSPWPAPERDAPPPTVPVRVRGRDHGGFERPRAWHPVHQLQLDDDGWRATGEDPQFLLDGGRLQPPLPAGWYEFRATLRVTEGQALAPCFYPDYGRGFSPDDLLLVPDPDASGAIRTLVLFKFPVHALRFDPSLRRCLFTLEDVSLARLAKPAALLRMLDGIREPGGRRAWPAAARAAGTFALDLRRGPSAAAARLHDCYRQHRQQGATSYDAWVRLHDTISASDVEAMRRCAARLPDPPLISLLVPVYRTPEIWLRRCLDSVLAQAYPHWELCVADDASPDPHVRAVLEEYARRDPRIRVEFRERNGHIAASSNTALAMARGEYVGLLDHDDELRPHALLAMAEAIVADRGVRLLYSDEDKIDGDGRRFQPYFKPDWNPDLLLGQNYLCHFSVLHTALAREVGGFREGFEGSQDHDLLLRCSERVDRARIVHVPRVLYHWRAIEGSTALRREAKDYAADAGARAVADHLARTGRAGRVEQLPHGHYRVHWQLPAPAPRVAIIVPTRDRLPLLRTCVESVFARTDYPAFRIVVVDNGSVEPETLAWLEAQRAAGRIEVRRDDQPFNYARLNNAAVAACDDDVVVLLNNDVEVISRDWLAELVSQALRPGVGAVGAMLYYPDDTIQHAGVVLGLGGVANHCYIRQPRGWPGHGARAKVVQEMSAVTGACLAMRRDTYLAVGGLDEQLQVAFNDIDLCLRLRERGLRNLWTPFAELYHHESATRGHEDSAEKRARFAGEVARMCERWGDRLHRDPAYNPNLTLDGFNFELAFPPRVPPGGWAAELETRN